MTIALWCLFLAAQLHFVSKVPLLMAQVRTEHGYDNNDPRGQQNALAGWGHRALAVHNNQIESFPFFAAGVLVTLAADLQSTWIDILAIGYIVTRLLYMFCYLKDLATLRSVVWVINISCSFILICSPAWA